MTSVKHGLKIAKVPFKAESPWIVLDTPLVPYVDENGTLQVSVLVTQSEEGIKGGYVVVFVKPRINAGVTCHGDNASICIRPESPILHREKSSPTSVEFQALSFDHNDAQVTLTFSSWTGQVLVL